MAINPAESQGWLGRSIQQSLMADLTMVAPGRVVSADQEAPDTAAALAAAHRADARFVVTGSFTTLNTSAGQGLRLMGQVIDADAGAPTGAFKATGLASEVFRLEDQVGNQIRHELGAAGIIAPPPVAEAPPSQPPSNQEIAGVYQQPNPYYQEYGQPQNNVPAQNYYNYYYGNPGYDSGGYYGGYYPYGWYGGGWYGGWPFWWGGAVIITNSHNHFHGGGHGNGGGHWNGGGGHWGGGGMHMAGGGMGGGMAHGGGGGHR